jgi:hypothetical protein
MGSVKHIALKVSLAMFFVMMLIGLIMGLPSEKIAVRAIMGAAVAFAASFVALRMAVGVLVQSVIDSDDSITTVDVDDEDDHGAQAEHSNDEAETDLATKE